MALNAGDAACSTGLSKRIFDNLTGSADNGFSSPMSSAQTLAVKALCYSVAKGVVDEITANAAVTSTASADAFGAGVPPAPVNISGTVA